MNIHDYRFLLADRGAPQKLLANIPAEDVIDRQSLEGRLRQVQAELEAYKDYSPRLVNAHLTFGGRPVRDHHSIKADFGTQAVQAFAKAVARIGASQYGHWAARRPVPNQERYALVITRLVPRSLGFELEAADTHPTLLEDMHPVAQAFRQILAILEASAASAADEQLAEAISEIDSRAREAVCSFLQLVADHEAVCAFAVDGRKFQFRETEQVRSSQQRLDGDNIQEEEVTLHGRFKGFLPKRRVAELHIDLDLPEDDPETIVHPRVYPAVTDEVDINAILGQPVRVKARRWRVGHGRSRYTITESRCWKVPPSPNTEPFSHPCGICRPMPRSGMTWDRGSV